MKKVFRNSGKLICIFDDEGISLYSPKQEAFYPYGCMKSLHVNLLGMMAINLGPVSATFLAEKEDRPAMRDAVREAKLRIREAEPQEYKIYSKCSKVDGSLPAEEQLKQYKHLFTTGTISKGYYDLKKRLLKD